MALSYHLPPNTHHKHRRHMCLPVPCCAVPLNCLVHYTAPRKSVMSRSSASVVSFRTSQRPASHSANNAAPQFTAAPAETAARRLRQKSRFTHSGGVGFAQTSRINPLRRPEVWALSDVSGRGLGNLSPLQSVLLQFYYWAH